MNTSNYIFQNADDQPFLKRSILGHPFLYRYKPKDHPYSNFLLLLWRGGHIPIRLLLIYPSHHHHHQLHFHTHAAGCSMRSRSLRRTTPLHAGAITDHSPMCARRARTLWQKRKEVKVVNGLSLRGEPNRTHSQSPSPRSVQSEQTGVARCGAAG